MTNEQKVIVASMLVGVLIGAFFLGLLLILWAGWVMNGGE